MTTISLDEFRSRERPEKVAQTAERLKTAAMEGVRAAALTGTPEWDVFLRYLEAQIKTAEAMIANSHLQFSDPTLVEADKIMRLKVKISCLNASAQILREVIMLPKFLIQNGHEAMEAIKLFPDDPQ